MIKLFLILAFTLLNSIYAQERTSFEEEILSKHNEFRKLHKVVDLKWSNKLQTYTQEWANKLAKENKMYHRSANEYGENIYWSMGRAVLGADVTQAWYDEIKDYSYSSPGFSMKTGHFTQVVWATSTELGCGKAVAKNGGVYVVCNYNPPGNYQGEFKSNVLPINP